MVRTSPRFWLGPWLVAGGAIAASCGDDDPGAPPASTASSSSSTTAATSSSAGGTGPGGGGGASSSSSGTGGSELPATFRVEGIVTERGRPLAGASVMQGGGEVQVVTGADGAFVVEMTTSLPGVPVVVAGKIGYRAKGRELYELPEGPVELELLFAEGPDNDAYEFGPPGDGAHDDSTEFCGHCHTTFVRDFLTSAHAHATRDPWVQDLYAGVASARSEPGGGDGGGGGAQHGSSTGAGDLATCADVDGEIRTGQEPGTEARPLQRCYVGDGVLPDLNGCGAPGELACDDPALPAGERPEAFGGCADCHAAGMDGPAGGRHLLDAVGVGFEYGNHCDACHHVKDVDLSLPPGTAGRLVLQRPRERVSDEPGAAIRQVMFGPFLDVPNSFMGGSYQPIFLEATLCAGCHEQKQDALLPGASLDRERWPEGLPVHSTFEEWTQSEYAAAGAPCQTCHMPAIAGMFNSVDTSTPELAGVVDGFGRPAERNRSHAFVGALQGEPRLLDVALATRLEAVVGSEPGRVEVDVTIVNDGAGHAVPTGEPMRALLLVLEVSGCGEKATALAGNAIGDTGGALASGVVGTDLQPNLVWPAAAPLARAGQRLRVTRPTGVYLDYPGVGAFADPSLTPEEKGIPVELPVADVEVTGMFDGTQILVNGFLDLQPGDRVWLGEPPILEEGAPAQALAGLPGQDFARVLVDPAGRRHVPHFRAVDLVSDHRIPPSGEVTSSHSFAAPEGCGEVEVVATLLYRRAPLALGRERGWALSEHVVSTHRRTVAVR